MSFNTHNAPLNLVQAFPHPETPWRLSGPLAERVSQSYAPFSFKKCQVLPSDPEWKLVWQALQAPKLTNFGVKRIFCVYQEQLLQNFEKFLWELEENALNPPLGAESNRPEPKGLFQATSIRPLWYGSDSVKKIESICQVGFSPTGKQKKGLSNAVGLFRNGINFTTSAQYAVDIYSKANGHLLLAWVSGGALSGVDEVVISEGDQMLPTFWVELQVELPDSLSSPVKKEDLLQLVFKALKHPAFIEDEALQELLRKKSGGLLVLKGDSSLSEMDRAFLAPLQALFATQGQVDEIARKQLIGISEANISEFSRHLRAVQNQLDNGDFSSAWKILRLLDPCVFEEAENVSALYDILHQLLPKLDLGVKEGLFEKIIEPLRALPASPKNRLQLEIDLSHWLSLGKKEEIDLPLFDGYARALYLAEMIKGKQLQGLYHEVEELMTAPFFERHFPVLVDGVVKKGKEKAVEALLKQLSLIKNLFCSTKEHQERLVPLYKKLLPFFNQVEPRSSLLSLLIEGLTPGEGKMPEPYIQQCRETLRSWKTTFASQKLLTSFGDVFNWEKSSERLLAALGSSSLKKRWSQKPFHSPLALFDAYCSTYQSNERPPFTLFAFQSALSCKSREEIAYFFPLIEGAIGHLLESKAPEDEHEQLYQLFSTNPLLEPLRAHYLSFLPNGPLLDKLGLIPNVNGFRQKITPEDEELKRNIEAMTQELPTPVCLTSTLFLEPRYLRDVFKDQLDSKGIQSIEVDFSTITEDGKPDLVKQELMLNRLQLFFANQEKPQKLTLTHCAALTAEKLLPFLHKDLTHLDLRGSALESIPSTLDNSSLKELYLTGCEKLKALDQRFSAQRSPLKLPRLEILHINNCPQLTAIQLENDRNLLRVVKINGNPKLADIAFRGNILTHIDTEDSPQANLYRSFVASYPEFDLLLYEKFRSNFGGYLDCLFDKEGPESKQYSSEEAPLNKKFCAQLGGYIDYLLRGQGSDRKECKLGEALHALLKQYIKDERFSFTQKTAFTFEFSLFNKIGSKEISTLAVVLENTSFTTLHLNDYSIDDEGAKAIAAVLENTAITTLDLSNNPFGAEGAKEIAAALKNTAITELVLGNNQIGAEGAKAIAAVLENTAITTLDLWANDIDDEGAKMIAAALGNTAITKLVLGHNKIGAEGVKTLAGALEKTAITELNLCWNDIGDEGAKVIAAALGNTAITKLVLGNNKIGAEGAKAIAAVLENTTITELNLINNKIGAEGAKEIAAVLENTAIKVLNLRENNIGEEGAKVIAAVLENTAITELNLERNKIGAEGAKAIAAAIEKTAITKLSLSYAVGTELSNKLKNKNGKMVEIS